jgi:hypothetical protein
MAESQQIDNGIATGSAILSDFLSATAGWISTQGAFLSGMETIWMKWAKRQRETVDVSSRSLQKMWECRNPLELARAQQEWLFETIQQTTVDVRTAAEHLATLSRKIADDVKSAPHVPRGEGLRSAPRASVERAAAE